MMMEILLMSVLKKTCSLTSGIYFLGQLHSASVIMLCQDTFYHPSILFHPLIRGRVRGQQADQGTPDVPLLRNAFQLFLGDLEVFPVKMRYMLSLQSVLGLPQGLLPVGLARTPLRGGILIRCLNNFT